MRALAQTLGAGAGRPGPRAGCHSVQMAVWVAFSRATAPRRRVPVLVAPRRRIAAVRVGEPGVRTSACERASRPLVPAFQSGVVRPGARTRHITPHAHVSAGDTPEAKRGRDVCVCCSDRFCRKAAAQRPFQIPASRKSFLGGAGARKGGHSRGGAGLDCAPCRADVGAPCCRSGC